MPGLLPLRGKPRERGWGQHATGSSQACKSFAGGLCLPLMKDVAQLLPLVYDELRRLAAAQMAREKPGQTLDATGLVHEAYLRLVSPLAAWRADATPQA